MILVGLLDSPFVRRVAVTMRHYNMPYERKAISVFRDSDEVRAINPLGMVPSLMLDDGETIFDSRVILDYLDETAGPDDALTPASGAARRTVQRLTTIALGAAEKAVALSYEINYRDPATTDPGVVERLEGQITSALKWLEEQNPGPWFTGQTMTQADVTAAVAVTYLTHKHPLLFPDGAYPALAALGELAEALPVFQAEPFKEG